MRTATRTGPEMLRRGGSVRPSLAGGLTHGNTEFRAVEAAVDRGGFAGVLEGLTPDCLEVFCRARHPDLQTGEAFVCECRASSQGKTSIPRAESREPSGEPLRLKRGAVSREPRAEG